MLYATMLAIMKIKLVTHNSGRCLEVPLPAPLTGLVPVGTSVPVAFAVVLVITTGLVMSWMIGGLVFRLLASLTGILVGVTVVSSDLGSSFRACIPEVVELLLVVVAS